MKLPIKFNVETCNIDGLYPLEDTNELELYEAKVKINALLNLNDKGELVENPDIEIEQFELTYIETRNVLVRHATEINPPEWETIEVRKVILSEAEGFEIVPNPDWSIWFNDFIDGCQDITIDMDNNKIYL